MLEALPFVLVTCLIYVFLRFKCENEVNGLRDNIDAGDIKIHLLINVFGQPLVHTILPKVLKEYSRQQQPGPLILSFHGTTGTGKNLVSNILADNFFVRGTDSKFFHMFLATKDFPATTNRYQLMEYEEDLERRLYVFSSCSPKLKGQLYCFLQGLYADFMQIIFTKENNICRRMYVFDEVDSLPDNLLSMFDSFMVSSYFKKTIFVLLSNVGGQEIYEEIETLEMNNFTKDQISHNKLVKLVEDAVAKSPPKYNPSMVHHIIPFLPLERDHVAMCIRREITRRIPLIREKTLIRLTENVLKELLFHGSQNKYSVTGCKNVVEKVNLVLARDRL